MIQVGQFLTFFTFTSAGFLLVLRSKEGGLLMQDVVCNLVTIAVHVFLMIMQGEVARGCKLCVSSHPSAVFIGTAWIVASPS